ncbi:MAG: protein kinase [Candidatus Obscuribacterales bacterium]|nr:protein kinase [Candidatus Obscuribacterales bacterium]
MLNNFTDEAIKVVQLAQSETEKLGHDVIGTEHLLLGLLSYETCKPSIVLKSMGITRRKAKEEVLRIMKRGKFESVNFAFTPRAKAVFQMAEDHRNHNEDHLVCPIDIMFALLTVPRCTAQKVLHALDVDTDSLITRLQINGAEKVDTGAVTLDQLEELHKRIRSGNLASDNENQPKDSDDGDETGKDPMNGYTIDNKYEVLSAIGYGGMGVVYKVRHLVLGRLFAIKIIHPYLASDIRNRRRFQREAQAASRLTHPNLATVFDWDIMEDGRPYIVMYYIDGVKLSELTKIRDTVEASTWISIFMQICDALTHAHDNGVLHRDLKPGNIILSKSDDAAHFVKIVDFGIAKILTQTTGDLKDLTKSGEVFGSPFYMSPEQCLGRALDVRSDIYSLGVVMYECFTGVCPFEGESLYDTMNNHVKIKANPFRDVDPNNSVSTQLEEIVLRCLAKAPEERYQSMSSLKRALIFALGFS